MSDNIFQRIGKAIVNKGTVQNFSLRENDRSFISLLSGALLYSYGSKNKGRYAFRSFLDAYGSNPLVYMIIKKISYTSASIKRIAVDSKGEEIKKSAILELLSRPNSEQGKIDFIEMINEYLSATGNVFILYERGIGAGEELRILRSDRVELICSKAGDVVKIEYTDYGGIIRKYDPDDVLHIKTSNIVSEENEEVKFGLSPLQAAWVIVKSSSEKFNAEASIFKNRGIIGVLTNDSDVPMLQSEKEDTQRQFNQSTGGSDKYNSIHVTNTRLKFIQTGMSPTDLKLLEGIVSSLRQLCAIYGMPSILFNDNERSTFNNYEQAIKIAYTDVYIPLANKIDKELSRFLSEKMGVEEIIKVDLTSIDVIKASTNEVAQALNNMSPLLANRVLEQLTINEIRDLAGLEEIEGGDEIAGQGSTQPTVTTEA